MDWTPSYLINTATWLLLGGLGAAVLTHVIRSTTDIVQWLAVLP